MGPFHNDVLTTVEQSKYRKAWRYLRTINILMIILMAFIIVWGAVFILLTQGQYASRNPNDWFQIPFGLFAICIVMYLSFRCPRCRKFYFFDGMGRSFTGRKCMNCGLPRNYTGSPNPEPSEGNNA
jgi:hypothetical protein